MKLSHYSNKPFTLLKRTDLQDDQSIKPSGLWVSVDGPDDWKNWCEAEDFYLENLKYKQEIILAQDANILTLTTPEELYAFTNEYKGNLYSWHMHWKDVAAKYAGIIIAPYIWECRLDPRTSWYYGWDCASGCIWNTNAIANLHLVR